MLLRSSVVDIGLMITDRDALAALALVGCTELDAVAVYREFYGSTQGAGFLGLRKGRQW